MKTEGEVALALVKTEAQTSTGVSSCRSSYPGENRDQMRMAYKQSCYDLSMSGYFKDEQRSTPDSTYEHTEERHVSRCSWLKRIIITQGVIFFFFFFKKCSVF